MILYVNNNNKNDVNNNNNNDNNDNNNDNNKNDKNNKYKQIFNLLVEKKVEKRLFGLKCLEHPWLQGKGAASSNVQVHVHVLSFHSIPSS